MRKILASAVVLAFLNACTSAPKSSESDITKVEPPLESHLQSRLGMVRSASELGFEEKSFDPCAVGTSKQCRSQFLAVVHFQLLCRDNEGSVSEVPLQLYPITSPNIAWQLGRRSGHAQTDINGFGQFSMVSDSPVRNRRLILRMGRQFVGLTASEITKVVLPKNWCTSST